MTLDYSDKSELDAMRKSRDRWRMLAVSLGGTLVLIVVFVLFTRLVGWEWAPKPVLTFLYG